MNDNSDNKMYEYGEENEHEANKLLGIYSSEQEASKAMERYYKLAVFKEYPKEFFIIDDYVVNKDKYWKEGFVNTADLDRDFETLTDCFNEWLGINKSAGESWEDDQYYNALCDLNKVMYEIKDIKELAEYIQKVWIRRFEDKTKSFDDYMEIAGVIISKGFYDLYV